MASSGCTPADIAADMMDPALTPIKMGGRLLLLLLLLVLTLVLALFLSLSLSLAAEIRSYGFNKCPCLSKHAATPVW